MEKFALVGSNISKSLSPILCKKGLNIEYDLIDTDNFEYGWDLFKNEYSAINITAPFKEIAFQKALKENLLISGAAYNIAAGNILTKTKESNIELHNSDFSAVIMCIAEAYFPGIVREFFEVYKDKVHIKVHQFLKCELGKRYNYKPQGLVVGCGGAAKAAAFALDQIGVEVSIMNRNTEKLNIFCRQNAEKHFIPLKLDSFIDAVRECDFIIYTIPCALDSLSELKGDVLRYNGKNMQIPPKLFIEAKYNPSSFSEEVLGEMLQCGSIYVSGLQWLLYQALAAYPLMTNKPINFTAMEQVIWDQL